ncbi:MAG TPA: alpha/beta hydrolase [Candidatus Limnocylindrales bacterium]|nr:alpha/beta hydrolase [Candidatus Limnocylindrales bacterium]
MQNKRQIGIVFIHGAGLGRWIWKDIKNLIKLPALYIDLPKKGTLEDSSNYASDKIKTFGKEKIILVCHSAGGVVGIKIADKIKGKLIGFIAVSAAIPRNKGSFLSCLPFPKNLIMSLAIRFAGTKPPNSAIVQGLCSDLTSEQAENVVKQFKLESKDYYSDKSDAPAPDTKKLFIITLKDKELPEELQRKMASNLRTDDVVSIDSGHMPMLSKPKQLAEIINNFANKI